MRALLRHTRLILVVLVVLAIVAVALWPDTMEVEVGEVVRGDMQVTLDEDGETRVRERFVVSAPVAGRLQRIELEPGDTVVQGKTVVARLSPTPAPLLDARTRVELTAAVEAARAAVGAARAERDRATEALARARATRARQEALAKAGAIATDDLEASVTAERTLEEALRAAEFGLTRAEYELELARARLQGPAAGSTGTVEVVAPVDGVVLRRLRQSETIVPSGDPLLEIGDPQQIEVVADFLSADAVEIQPDAPVIIEGWGGEEPLRGRVRRVEPAGFMKVSALGVEERRVNVIVALQHNGGVDGQAAGAPAQDLGGDDNGSPVAPSFARLGDGYRVQVRAVVWETPDAIQAPIGSLFRQGDGWGVFVLNEGVAELRPVAVGRRNNEFAQILDGLSAGDRVVMHPPDTLNDRMRVTPRGE